MSRHRFVRNLDLDDEMNDEEEEGYSQEEQAQMAAAMPIARNALKDLKPPISDDAIADSLWHYWFDVEKTVAWLKQDHEKKGEAPHPSLQPTPKEQPRRRPKNLLSSIPSSLSDSPQPPISALQRLSLARKQASSSPSTPAPPSAPSSTAAISENGSKPMSKLALLAQKRKEAAAQAAGSPSTTSSSSATPTKSAMSSTPASGTQSPATEFGSKPLSKLAQKMAAARAAREESTAKSVPPASAAESLAADESSISTSSSDPITDIFPTFTPLPKKKTASSPSTFFSILTSTSSAETLQTEIEVTNLHVPLATDVSSLTKRFEQVFAESPDEVVLRKRQGRAGTADLNTVVKKQAKGTGLKPK